VHLHSDQRRFVRIQVVHLEVSLGVWVFDHVAAIVDVARQAFLGTQFSHMAKTEVVDHEEAPGVNPSEFAQVVAVCSQRPQNMNDQSEWAGW
jgi:hypothetical protein